MSFTDNFRPYVFPTLGYIRIPKLEIPPDDMERLKLDEKATSEKYLSELVREGLAAKIKAGLIPEADLAKYKERANMEFLEIKRLLFTDYITLIYRIIKFCKDNDILNGPARGSCGGSLLLYLIGVIQIDPIQYDLLFERFISAARTEIKEIDGHIYIKSDSLPDVDIDSEGSKKHLINKFLQDTFPNKTCAILNISFFQGKLAIKEVLKTTLAFSEDDSKRISGMIESKFGKVDSIADSIENNEEFKAWMAENPKHKKAAEAACIINSLIKTTSVHASGILICENDLEETLPCQLTSDKKLVASYDMNYCNLVGIKVDNLGLKNLNAVHEAFRMTGVNYDNFDPNDPSIYKFLNESSCYYGIFQAEEGLGKDTLRKIKPTNIEDIILSISLGRPGSMNYIKDYIDFKEGKVCAPEGYPEKVKEVLAVTGYQICYQEQIMKLSRIMAGFSPLETNLIRKFIGKKQKEKLIKYKSQFIDGSVKNGYTEEFASKIWQSFEQSGDYSFNRCIYEEEVVEVDTGELKRLKHITKGEKVKAFDVKANKTHYVEVLNVYKNKKELWNLNLGYGTIKTSKDHKFLCEDLVMRPLYECVEKEYRIARLTNKKVKFHKIIKAEKSFTGNTIDLEVNHPDHNFYCNGFVVSNSHATGYGKILALSAYLKGNYPKEFFLSLLRAAKDESNPTEELSKIQGELKHFNIKLLPPHLLKSEADFTIEGPNIRFGLTSIKGISEKTIDKLNHFKDEFSTKFQIFEAAEEAGLNLGALCALLQAGALDGHAQSRSRAVLEAQLWSLLTEKEKKWAANLGPQYDYDLLQIIKDLHDSQRVDEDNKIIIKKSRFETIKKHYAPYKEIFNQNSKCPELADWHYERYLLGFSYSQNLKTIYSSFNPNFKTLEEINKLPENSKVSCVAVVQEESSGKSRAKGTRYVKLVLMDETGSISALMFNDKIDRCKENNLKLPSVDDIVCLNGTRKGDAIFVDMLGIQSVTCYTKLSQMNAAKKSQEKLDKKKKSS